MFASAFIVLTLAVAETSEPLFTTSVAGLRTERLTMVLEVTAVFLTIGQQVTVLRIPGATLMTGVGREV